VLVVLSEVRVETRDEVSTVDVSVTVLVASMVEAAVPVSVRVA